MRDDPPPPVVLECEDLAFDYDTHKDEFGLRDVSLRLRAGRALGVIGPDVHLYAKCTRHRKIRGTWFTDYTFRFTQGDKELYRSLQSAGWVCKDQSPVD